MSRQQNAANRSAFLRVAFDKIESDHAIDTARQDAIPSRKATPNESVFNLFSNRGDAGFVAR